MFVYVEYETVGSDERVYNYVSEQFEDNILGVNDESLCVCKVVH